MTQPTLFAPPRPPDLRDRGIDLRLCSCADPEFVRDAEGARLFIADPPWSYVQKIGASRAENHYTTLPHSTIVEHLNAFACGRMALWATGPTEAAFDAAVETARANHRWRWGRHVSSGAWVKSGDGAAAWGAEAADDRGHYGPGHVWAGCSEPVRVYTYADTVTHKDVPLRNAWIEPPQAHSRKPVRWMVQWVLRWTDPGDLIVDPYAGLGSVAEAVMLAGGGRRYLGAEISADRRDQALSLLAQVRW